MVNNFSKDQNPLVSVLVITYNSSKYVLETLESAKNQDYDNVELIITDDCSTDNTFAICQNWIKFNKDRFIHSKIVRTPKNKGISGNCNHGLSFCTGKWVKLIAGDDILLNNCVTEYINYIKNNNEFFVFSFPSLLMDQVDEQKIESKEIYYVEQSNFFEMSAWQQHKFLIIYGLPMSASTFFFNRHEIKKTGGFDEDFFVEDRPLYMKLTKIGYKLGNIHKKLVKYRIHGQNTSTRNRLDTPVNEYWFRRVHDIVKNYLDFKLFINDPLVFLEYYNNYFVNHMTLAAGNNQKNFRILRKLRYLSPLYTKKHLIK